MANEDLSKLKIDKTTETFQPLRRRKIIRWVIIFLCVIVIGVLFVRFWRTRALVTPETRLEPLFWGLHTGLLGALVGGLADHYFFNLDFHHSVTLFWLVAGLATTATELIKQQTEQPTNDGTTTQIEVDI